jgi:hypothetical protein
MLRTDTIASAQAGDAANRVLPKRQLRRQSDEFSRISVGIAAFRSKTDLFAIDDEPYDAASAAADGTNC